jgi:trimeric autotransporter adhesin
MSTKTTFKRIALVAVASLGFGLLSVVPSNAAVPSITGVSSKSAASLDVTFGTVSNTSASADFVTSVTLPLTAIGRAIYTAADGYIGTVATVTTLGGTFTAVTTTTTLTTAVAYLGTLPTTTTSNGVTTGIINGMTVTAGKTVGLNVKYAAGTPAATEKTRAVYAGIGVAGTSAASAAATTQVNSFISFTAPATAGTYPMSIEHSVLGTFLTAYPNADRPFADIAFTLTVTAASGLSTALSTALITNTTTATPTTNAVAYAGYKTVNAAIAQVIVSLKNADGTATAAGHVVTASIAGAGFVLTDADTTMKVTTGLRSSAAASAAGVAVVHIGADGTTGTGTVTVSVTDAATLATTVLGTFTVTTYGNVAKLEISTTNFTIGLATGETTGFAEAARGNDADLLGALTTILTPAFIVKTTDAAGNVSSIANALVPTIVSSNSVSVSGGTCVLDNGAGVYSSGDGVGYYNCSFSTTAASKSGDKATLTVRTLDPATGTTYLSATVDVTVGGARYKETISLDKASYNEGEAMVVTRTAVDDAGNPVADGSAVPSVVFNKAIGGAMSTAAVFYVGGKVATSATKPVVFAPTSSGVFEARIVGLNGSLITTSPIITTATVAQSSTEAAASAAGDAAAEATDAANAATDAANAAAEAADAATAAAQDAADAVAALSTSVTAMVADLRKQITALTNLVIKIQKKVKA